MIQTAEARKRVGRKKKEIPSDYRQVKVPRDVYLNLKLLSTLSGREMALIVGDVLREPLAKMVDEAYKASRPKPPK